MDLILFGIQGSGKGTQGEKIARKYHLEMFETGACLRKLAQQNSKLGQKVKSIIESGKLVPNEVVMEIVANFAKNIPRGKNILFDGIPRQIEQQRSLESLLQKLGRQSKALLINISKQEALKRLTTRRICQDCKKVYPVFYQAANCQECNGPLITRTDDNPESIQARLDAYEQETVPIIEDYRQQDRLIEINGEQSIEEVSKDIFKELDQIYSKS